MFRCHIGLWRFNHMNLWVAIVISVLVYRVDLNLCTFSSVSVSNHAAVLLSKPVLISVDGKVASAFTKLWTSFSTATFFEKSNGGIVWCFIFHGLHVTRMNMVFRSYRSCILSTCSWILILNITVLYVKWMTWIIHLSNALNMLKGKFIMSVSFIHHSHIHLSWVIS